MPFRGISGNRKGLDQYVYDPTFVTEENYYHDDKEDCYPEIPFMSYIKNTPERKDRDMDEEKKKNNKTPRTMMRMMERHRENERMRHHTLNNSMKKVCDRVPGASPFMKETKVVMMQRIIAYICFLENTINSVCNHLGIKQLRMSTNFITEQSSDKYERRTGSIIIKRKLSPAARRHERHRLKLSSPTIDSTTTEHNSHTVTTTTEHNSHTVTQSMVLQDSQGISSTNQDSLFIDDNACCAPEDEQFLCEDFLPSTSKLDNFPDAFELLSSPVGNLPKHLTIDSSEECGITEDRENFDVAESPLRTISPESILPTTLSQSSEEGVTPTKHRKKKINLFRSPFEDITNLQRIKSEPVVSKEAPVSYVPYILHKSSGTRRKLLEQPPSLSILESRNCKIDHRKTTWMNGFMMFSRLNRRSFIEANPGVHTSHISKMMGHAWRQMTSDDQLPYREKAKDFAEKNLICDESSDDD